MNSYSLYVAVSIGENQQQNVVSDLAMNRNSLYIHPIANSLLKTHPLLAD